MYLLGLGILLKLIHFILGVSFELIGSKGGNMRVEVFFGNNLSESLIPLWKKIYIINKKGYFCKKRATYGHRTRVHGGIHDEGEDYFQVWIDLKEIHTESSIGISLQFRNLSNILTWQPVFKQVNCILFFFVLFIVFWIFT